MSVVYSMEDLETGRFPRSADGMPQVEAVKIVAADVILPRNDDPIVMGFSVIGSTLSTAHPRSRDSLWLADGCGTANRKSDIDLVIFEEPDGPLRRQARFLIEQSIARATAEHGVVFTPQWIPFEKIKAGYKPDPYYAMHIRRCALLWQDFTTKLIDYPYFSRSMNVYYGPKREKGLALKAFLYHDDAHFALAEPYFDLYTWYKGRQLAGVFGQPYDATKIHSILDLPRNLSRKALSLTDAVLELPKGQYFAATDTYIPGPEEALMSHMTCNTGYHDSSVKKLAVAANYFGFKDNAMQPAFTLEALSTEYSEVLEAAIAGKISFTEYDQWIRGVYQSTPELVKSTLAFVNSYREKLAETAKKWAPLYKFDAYRTDSTHLKNGSDEPMIIMDSDRRQDDPPIPWEEWLDERRNERKPVNVECGLLYEMDYTKD